MAAGVGRSEAGKKRPGGGGRGTWNPGGSLVAAVGTWYRRAEAAWRRWAQDGASQGSGGQAMAGFGRRPRDDGLERRHGGGPAAVAARG